MLMTRDNANNVLWDIKTQTRRKEAEDDYTWIGGYNTGHINAQGIPLLAYTSIHAQGGRVKWAVNQTYAICPGRGKRAIWYTTDDYGHTHEADEALWAKACEAVGTKTVGKKAKQWMLDHDYCELRVRVTALWREHVQDISEEDAFAEGCQDNWQHDDSGNRIYISSIELFRELWDSINKEPGTRWADNPAVWCIQFERVKPWEAKNG